MATSIDKKSIQLMIDRYQRELDDLFEQQESERAEREYSSKLKAWGGLEVPYSLIDTFKYLNNRTPIQGVDTSNLGQDNPYLQATAAANDKSLRGFSEMTPDNVTHTGLLNDLGDRYGGYLNTAATLSPVLYNTYMGLQKPRQLNAKNYYNPYANQVASLMRDRRVNVQPQLDAALDAQRIAMYNAGRVGAGGMGNIQGNYAAIGNNAMRTRANILANKQNMDLGYMGEQAQMLNQEGLHRAGINFNVADWNERAAADRRNYLGTAASQASQLAQVNKQMAGQTERDKMLYGLYGDMFSVSKYMPYLEQIKNYLDKVS